MYTANLFEENDPRILHDFMREFSFALLVTAKNGTPFGSHLPLSFEVTGAKGTLFGHPARVTITGASLMVGQRPCVSIRGRTAISQPIGM